MKRILYTIMNIVLLLSLCSCGEEKQPSFSQEKLIEITSRQVGISDSCKIYTLHICVYNDCTVKIYADDFPFWYGEKAADAVTTTITKDELEDIKKMIIDNDAVALNKNVGNIDMKEGTQKGFIIYADDGSHESGGLNPSNRSFLRVYDFVYNLVREESFIYCSEIENIQLTGYNRRFDIGPRIHDNQDNVVISTDMIQDFVIVPASEIATDTDAEPETTEVYDYDMGADAATEENSHEDMYGLAIMLNEDGTNAIYEATGYNIGEPKNFLLYVDNRLYETITIRKHVSDGTIYLNGIYDKTSAEDKAAELEECLNLWRSFKSEEQEKDK